jgi:hypothetical protein
MKAFEIIPKHVPKIMSQKVKDVPIVPRTDLQFYEMSKIIGDNLYLWIIENSGKIQLVLPDLLKLVKTMHYNDLPSDKNDIYMMYFLKPSTALKGYLRFTGISPERLTVNGSLIINPETALEGIYRRLETSLIDTRYTFIHGDLTLSNTIYGIDGVLSLVDPRGRFGDTQFFGDIRYDVAKLYYSLVGNFDSLNWDRFSCTSRDRHRNVFDYSIEDMGLGYYKDIILREFSQKEELIEFIHATIWISLIPHLADNPQKQLCAFLNGTFLLNSLML